MIGGNCRGLRLIEQIVGVLERVVEGLVWQGVEVGGVQCGFVSGRGTAGAVFVVRQLRGRRLAAGKTLCMAFVGLEGAFGRVLRDVVWWAMHKLGIDGWLVRVVRSVCGGVGDRVRMGGGCSGGFGVGVGVRQGSVLGPLLFVIVLGALSGEFRAGCPWGLLYADDLMVSAGSREELLVRVGAWRTGVERRGLRVNMGRAGIVRSGVDLDVLKRSGGCPCGVCLAGVGGIGAVLCDGCERWMHKKCSGIKGRLLPENEFTCARCLGTARAVDGRQSLEVEVGSENLEVVPEFCYLGDMLYAGGGCELTAITSCKCAWGKFRQLLPLLTNRQVPLLTRGKVYSSCVRSVMLYAAGTWAVRAGALGRLRRGGRAVVC